MQFQAAGGKRESVVGFGPDSDFAKIGQTKLIERTMKLDAEESAFVPTRLLIPSIAAKFYDVAGILCDGEEQMVNAGAIPAVVFSEEAIGTSMSLAPAFHTLAIRITRNTRKPQSWLVRTIRRWLDFPTDPAKPMFAASFIGTIVPKDEAGEMKKAKDVPIELANQIVGSPEHAARIQSELHDDSSPN